MPKIVEVPGMGNVEFPDTMDDNAIGAAIAKQMPSPSPRQKMVSAVDKLLPGVPESSAQALNMGMGMSMPNPVPMLGQLLKGKVQIGMPDLSGLPKMPELMEAALPSKVSKVYEILRRGAGKAAPSPEVPVPYEAPPPTVPGPETPYPARAPPPASPRPIDAALQTAAAESRARVMANAERMRAVPEAPPAPSPQAPPPAAPTATASVPEVPAPAASPIMNMFEQAGRGKKVSELVKAIDANAGMHLGVDMRDPRAAEALASLPAQWWEGMAQASGVNKPSQETINQALEFFRDRAAQGLGRAVNQ